MYIMNNYISFSIFSIFLLFLFIAIIASKVIDTFKTPDNNFDISNGKQYPIYCLMITGKNNQRYNFAKIALQNFLQQTYDNKYLIIVNEGKQKIVNCNNDWERKHIFEIQVNREKTKMKLGDLRNISLQLVPPNAIWTTWDDDDWRHKKYLDTLYRALINSRKKFLMYKNRIDHNFNTSLTYRVTIHTGGYIFFAFNDPNIWYDSLDTKEDAVVKRYFEEQMKLNKVLLFNNDPKLYIRFIHTNNTSLFINQNKTNLISNKVIHETDVSASERLYVNNVIKKYYRNV